MPSLNVDLDFFDHPKVKRLRALAGPQAEVFIMRLWAYAGKYHAADGILKDHGAPEIEALINWTGNPGDMLQALLKAGFVVLEEGQYKIKDWLEHEGHLIIYRTRAIAANKARWSGNNASSNTSSNTSGNASRNPSSVQYIAEKKQPETFNKISDNKKAEAKSLIPTLAEVQEYCKSKGVPADPVKFWSHYQGVGWKIGAAPIKDWQAVLLKWTTPQAPPQQQSHQAAPRAPKMAYETPFTQEKEDPKGWEPLK